MNNTANTDANLRACLQNLRADDTESRDKPNLRADDTESRDRPNLTQISVHVTKSPSSLIMIAQQGSRDAVELSVPPRVLLLIV